MILVSWMGVHFSVVRVSGGEVEKKSKKGLEDNTPDEERCWFHW